MLRSLGGGRHYTAVLSELHYKIQVGLQGGVVRILATFKKIFLQHKNGKFHSSSGNTVSCFYHILLKFKGCIYYILLNNTNNANNSNNTNNTNNTNNDLTFVPSRVTLTVLTLTVLSVLTLTLALAYPSITLR